MSQIQVGDKFPSGTLKNQFGEEIDLDTILGKQACVVFFYPKDFTAGCTKEVCSFQDNLAVFNQLDIKVFGISNDSVKKHASFAQQYHVEYDLLSDKGGAFKKVVGVPSDLFGLVLGRVTYLVDNDGKVSGIVKSQMNIHKHLEEAIAVSESLKLT